MHLKLTIRKNRLLGSMPKGLYSNNTWNSNPKMSEILNSSTYSQCGEFARRYIPFRYNSETVRKVEPLKSGMKGLTALLLCDFSLSNPPDFFIQQLKMFPSSTNLWVLARNTNGLTFVEVKAPVNLIEHRDSKLDKILLRFTRRFKLGRSLEVIFQPHSIIKMLRVVLRVKPDLIHIHGLGGAMTPLLLIPLFSRLRCITLITHHGFSSLNSGAKLYPSEASRIGEFNFSEMTRKAMVNSTDSVSVSFTEKLFSKLRMKLVAKLINFASVNIAISKMQSEIFATFHIRVDYIIPNSTSICSCEILVKNESGSDSNQEIKILFLGRPIGKGLERIVELAKSSDHVHVFIAGYSESELVVKSIGLPHSKYTYLGYLQKADLYPLFHDMHFVACLSTCFDTFPTVAIEALTHGSVPIVTPSTGVAEFLHDIHPYMVWPMNSELDFNYLSLAIKERPQILKAIKDSSIHLELSQKSNSLQQIYHNFLK
jgi:glycosyltransferase involved in cell wall biosynthesis